ncbi:MAG: molybdenum cofactor guanylyltransferase MobA [Azospirillum sp.]|nr:molybdenum cofactor guanylyltransferase MobA [Azospirillum sp.]
MTVQPVAVVLAGGLATRLGGRDKSLLPLAGRPLLAHILDRIAPQVGAVAINANGDPARFAGFGLPVVADGIAGFPGPLAGVLAGLEWARRHAPESPDILTVPGDTPFLPWDLVDRLDRHRTAAAAELACAASAGRTHPVIGLWPVARADALRRAVVGEGVRKVGVWAARYRLVTVDFACQPLDPFFNVNTEDDLVRAAALAGG